MNADVVLPPSALPGGDLPYGTDVVLASAKGAGAVELVRAGAVGVAPGTVFTTLDGDDSARRRADTLRGVLAGTLRLDLLIGLLAFLVAAVDRAFERRANLMAL